MRALAGERVQVVWPMPTVTGDRLWIEYAFNPVRDEHGNVSAVAMLARDITDRKATEEALADATAHHRIVVENTSDALFVLEVDGDEGEPEFRVGMVNSAFERLTGLREAEISGRLVREVLPPAEWLAARERYLQAIAAR
jgi:PAS domain-containing protein